ncbi:MAG: hypothetical protein Q9168_005783 [Polycauliona sp. 1 TL-2023]
MPQNPSASRVPPTLEDWEARRERISQLYFDDDETLSKVVSEVNEPGVFEPTARMYKARIRKWGLDKKIKEHEARAMIHLFHGSFDKSAVIRLRGRPVDHRKVERYFHRKGIAIDQVLRTPAVVVSDVTMDVPTSLATVVRTSSRKGNDASSRQDSDSTTASFAEDELPTGGLASTGSPRYMSSPDDFMIAESVFAGVHEYVLQSFGLGFWVSHGSEEFCRNSKTIGMENPMRNRYDNEARTACILFEKNQPEKANQILQQVLGRAKILIHTQDLRALPYIIDVLASLIANRKYQCAMQVLEQLSVASGLDSSQTTRIFKRIFWMMRPLVCQAGADGFLLAIVRSLVGVYENVLGASHLQTMQTISVWTRVFTCIYGPVGLDMHLNNLYRSMVTQFGAQSVRSLSVLLDIANIQFQNGRYLDAEATAQKIVQAASELNKSVRTRATVLLLCDSYCIVSQAQNKLGSFRAAVGNYWKALEINERFQQRRFNRILRELSLGGTYLISDGRYKRSESRIKV